MTISAQETHLRDQRSDAEPYPEHAKLLAVQEASQTIGEFLDIGLSRLGMTLCKQIPRGDNGEPEYVWRRPTAQRRNVPPTFADYLDGRADLNHGHDAWSAHFAPNGEPITSILARYFDIDLDRIEAEKREMLNNLHAKSERSS